MILGIWLSSGTMAPYAATVPFPLVTEPCHYLINVDHPHHIALFRMLAGADPHQWQGSVMLRRLLYPIVAYPFVRVAGYLGGGLICNALINVGAMLAFAEFVRRRWGQRPAIAVLWLLATYPGITYWAGLPYGYAAIVPASLWAMALLYRINEATSLRELIAASTMLGVTFLAYDLLPFFLPAAALLLVARSRYLWAVLSTVIAILPSAAVGMTLAAMSLLGSSDISSIYRSVALSYLRVHDVGAWIAELLRLPGLLALNYLFSNFLFLPVLFLIVVFTGRRHHTKLTTPEVAVLLSALAIFLFNNAAPPYYGWQMRGTWIARLYQPIFVVFVLVCARAAEWRPIRHAIVVVVLANAAIVAGPVTMTPLGEYAYHKFYAHSPRQALRENLHLYGRRPLGICRTSHEIDGQVSPATPSNRPPFMFRYPDERR